MFSAQENRILKSRLNGISFEQIGDAQKKASAIEIMSVVSAMSGGALPTTKTHLEFIISILTRFILDNGFGKLTFDEFILAFELNIMGSLSHEGLSIDFNGQNFNIAYMGAVLKKYMVARNIIDGKIKNEIG